MRSIVASALVVALVAASGSNVTAGGQEGSVTILDPVGGEAWSGVHLVRWADSYLVADKPIHWDLSYSLDLGASWVNVPGAAGDYRSTTSVVAHSWPFDTRSFADTNRAMFRVTLTLTGSGTSTNLVATTANAISFDNTDPSSGATVTGTAGDAPWLVSDAFVALAAADATSGVGSISWRVDGGGYAAYADPIVVGEGDHLVEWFATDRAGNAEAVRSERVRVDVTAPATTHVLQGVPGDDDWWTSAVNVALYPADGTSGVARTFARADGAPFGEVASGLLVAGDGDHVADYYAVDAAGNAETPLTTSFRIDATPPASAYAIGGPSSVDARGRVYVASGTPITLSATDATSGVRDVFRSIDGASYATYGDPIHIEGADGLHTVEFYAVDRAGNIESLHRLEVYVDNTAPALEITRPLAGSASLGPVYFEAGATFRAVESLVPAVPGAPVALPETPALPIPSIPPPNVDAGRDDVTPVAGAVTVEVATSDGDGAGVDRVEYYVDGVLRYTATGGDYSWVWDTTVDRAGQHLLEARSVDELGWATTRGLLVDVVPLGQSGLEATAHAGASWPGWLTRVAPALAGIEGADAILAALPALPA